MSKDYVFGIHAVVALLERDPASIDQLWLQEGREDRRLQQVRDLAVAAGLPLTTAVRRELDQRVRGRHQGVVARRSGSHPGWQEADLPELLAARPAPLVLVLDGVTDPHNLGACLRTADAAGVTAVLAPRDRAAGLGPTVRKVACGAAETMPFVTVTNLARSLRELQQQGLWLVGTAGEAEQCLYDLDLTGPVALLLGAEGRGLRRLTRELCDHLVHLPMAGSLSSLNVSVAAGVALFEAVRQRRGGL